MSFVVVLISAGNAAAHPAAEILTQCGIQVVTPQMPAAADGSAYRYAACVIIDMPGTSGLQTLRMMRHYGVAAPALLIADEAVRWQSGELKEARVLDVIKRPASRHVLLRWVEAICVLRLLAAESQWLSQAEAA